MNALSAYHRLPPFLRNCASNARGAYLQHLRYAGDTEGQVRAALRADYVTPGVVSNSQAFRLAEILHIAAREVPYYRTYWAGRRGTGNLTPWEELSRWPVVEKESVRECPEAFLRGGRPRAGLRVEHTSGSTGKPLKIWVSRETTRAWYSLFEARWRRWYGVSRKDRWALLGGQLVTPVSQTKPPFWVWNQPMRQLYLSSYHLAPQYLSYYLEALHRYQVKYLYGYTSSLNAVAQEALRRGWSPPRLAVAITNAEPVYPYQRDAIQRAFQCPVRETYGLSEMTAAASECESGRLHLWPEVGVVEVLDGGQTVEPGESGDLVCTGLLNHDMLLIRYRGGDRGVLSQTGVRCECGRTLPILESVDGRRDDLLLAGDGRMVGRMDPVFKSDLPVREAQIVQDTLSHVRVLIVPALGFGAEAERRIREAVAERLPGISIDVEIVQSLPRGANGKLRAVVNLVGVR